MYPRFTHESGTIRKKQAIDVSKLKRLLCYESQHQRQSNEKSLVQFDYEKAVSNYLGTQSTFNTRIPPSPLLILIAHTHPPVAFARDCFTSKLYCGSQSSFDCHPQLQSLPYCNIIARPLRNIRPPPPSPPSHAIPYAILVMAISCKGQPPLTGALGEKRRVQLPLPVSAGREPLLDSPKIATPS